MIRNKSGLEVMNCQEDPNTLLRKTKISSASVTGAHCCISFHPLNLCAQLMRGILCNCLFNCDGVIILHACKPKESGVHGCGRTTTYAISRPTKYLTTTISGVRHEMPCPWLKSNHLTVRIR